MLTITVKSQPVADVLAKLAKRVGDLTPAMRDIGAVMETRVLGRFEMQSDPMGRPWAQWAPATVKTYPKDGNRKILDRYGHVGMLNSLNFQASKDTVRVGFGAPYAIHHEFGTAKMPRRGLLFADPDAGALAPADERMVLDVLDRFIAI